MTVFKRPTGKAENRKREWEFEPKKFALVEKR